MAYPELQFPRMLENVQIRRFRCAKLKSLCRSDRSVHPPGTREVFPAYQTIPDLCPTGRVRLKPLFRFASIEQGIPPECWCSGAPGPTARFAVLPTCLGREPGQSVLTGFRHQGQRAAARGSLRPHPMHCDRGKPTVTAPTPPRALFARVTTIIHRCVRAPGGRRARSQSDASRPRAKTCLVRSSAIWSFWSCDMTRI